MSDTAYTARSNARLQVVEGISKLTLNLVNLQYDHEAGTQFVLGLNRVLRGTFNASEPGQGMAPLLRSNSKMAAIKSTDAANMNTIIEDSIAEAKAKQDASDDPSKKVEPLIQTRADAMDAADRYNIEVQAVIGAKEGAIEAITQKVGANVTDVILRTADGTDYKSVDDVQIQDLTNAVLQAATRPKVRHTRQSLIDAISFRFNFRQRISDNVAVLRAKAAKLSAYGIILPNPILATIIMAEADAAGQEKWGREIETEVAKLRLKYPFSHVHDDASIADIMAGLAAADSVRNLSAAPAPTAQGTANAAQDAHSVVQRLIFDEDSSHEGTAYSAAGYESDSSAESSRPSRSKSKARGRSKSRDDRHRSKSRDDRHRNKAEDNPCPHCRKWGRRNLHPPKVTDATCFWNKKWKGFRPDYCCQQMKLPFKKKSRFPPHLGGWPEAGDTSEEE